MRCIASPSLSMLTLVDYWSEFLAFAEFWYRLADDIDISNRLIALIDSLPVNKLTMANTQPEEKLSPAPGRSSG